jgi:hypothetical protein
VARLNEVRFALASLARESDSDNKTKLESGKLFESDKKRKQATRLNQRSRNQTVVHSGVIGQGLWLMMPSEIEPLKSPPSRSPFGD